MRVRVVVAITVLAVGFSAAIYLHQRRHLIPCGLGADKPVCAVHSSWQNPTAIGIAVAGGTVAVAIIVRRRHFANPTW